MLRRVLQTRVVRTSVIYVMQLSEKRNILLASSPGHDLQHFPGNNVGSSQLGFGHSFFIFRHCTRPIILLFF